MATDIIDVEPKVLVWARTSMALDIQDAAARLKVPVQRLEAWESGAESPTMAQIRRMAALYRRPVALLFLSFPPKQPSLTRHFRRTFRGTPVVLTPELALQVRRAESLRDTALELCEELSRPVHALGETAQVSSSPAELADRVRSLLGISEDVQKSWKDQYAAFRGWRESMEDHGVLVFQMTGVPVSLARGLSLPDRPFPVILVNSADAPAARCFTLCHELGHVLLGDGDVCDIAATGGHESKAEQFCNALAGAMLVPESYLRGALATTQAKGVSSLDAVLRQLSRRFWVSEEVVLRRLLEIHAIPHALFVTKQDELRRRRFKPSKGGAPPFHVRVLANLGRAYVRLVFGAYNEGRLSLSKVSEYLGARVKHLQKIESVAFSH